MNVKMLSRQTTVKDKMLYDSIHQKCSELANSLIPEVDWWLPKASRRKEWGATIYEIRSFRRFQNFKDLYI